MPALSKKQQKFMGIVRSIQKGEQPASKFSKDAQDVAKDMKKSSVKKFAGTKHKGLPSKVRKEYILNKLRKTIREELEDYRYGSGDIVKDVNPTCPHYGAQGKVKSVNPRSVVFVVMNKGKNFKPGMKLEKSHDQMKKMNENKVYKVGDTVSLLSFDRRHRGRAKVKGVTKSRANKFGIKNHYITNKGTFTDMEVEGTEAFKLRFKGDTEKKVTKAMNSPYGVVLPEEINEFSMKLQKSTQDMVDALLKIKNPMPKEIESALIMMAKGYGLDYVKKEVKKDAKGFYKNLKQMAAAFPEFRNKPKDYKFESVIQEMISVKSSKEYFDNLDTAINLIVRQANNLKGQLGKHPIKQNVNKLKAVKTMLKRGISPAFYAYEKDRSYSPSFKATDLNYIKKSLQNGKFRRAVSELMRAIDTRSYDSNDFYFLKNDYKKEDKLRQRLVGVLKDLVNKMEKAQLENINEKKKKMFPPDKMTPKQAKEYKKFIDYAKMGIEYKIDMSLFESVNEDGHTDVASSKRKVMIMVDDSNKLLNKLNGMNKEDSLPSWWSDKITLSQNYLEKATNYLLNPVESVNEIRNNREAQTAMNQIGNKALYMIGAKDFVTGTSDGKKSLVFKIMRNSKGVSHIRMRLSSMDLYDMDFLAIRAGKIKIKSKEKGVYGDQLGAMIKKNTGLNIRL